jgi:hypothetical protein
VVAVRPESEVPVGAIGTIEVAVAVAAQIGTIELGQDDVAVRSERAIREPCGVSKELSAIVDDAIPVEVTYQECIT